MRLWPIHGSSNTVSKCHLDTTGGFGWLLKSNIDTDKTQEFVQEFKYCEIEPCIIYTSNNSE